ncbi:PAS domain-containing protein [Pseudoroseicyclus tamaricis]|uniref:histidine kinase n=1 Tax=Pseudoroseicyclus tamaricis TaxID=2705421 RepID=A0A6B2K1Y6_9RHOB|nr:PAS domain-containing protein [Pseudoroseicyclus tamaricis]NDV01782.1 PAS domain-containing protein [Pseudoroseicyclus tamaricis]
MTETFSSPFPPEAFTDREAMALLDHSNISLLVTDPRQPDNPIVYVNAAFEKVTGYRRDEVMGKNCRFMQGIMTDPEDVDQLRRAIAEEEETTVDILNYRKDGTTFVNRLVMTPVRENGVVTYFLGVQKPLTRGERLRSVNFGSRMVRELQHRVKNHLAMIASLIRMEGRRAPDRAPFDHLIERIAGLQALYEELSDPAGGDRTANQVSLGSFLERIARAVSRTGGHESLKIEVDVPEGARVSALIGGKLGFIASEIVTNAMKHAYEGRENGTIRIAAEPRGKTGVRIVFSDDGSGIADGAEWPRSDSVGGRVLAGLLAELEADLDVESGPTGTTITIDIPEALSASGS